VGIRKEEREYDLVSFPKKLSKKGRACRLLREKCENFYDGKAHPNWELVLVFID